MTYGEFVDTITNGNEFASAPNKTVHFDGLDLLEHLIHVSLIVPRLDIEKDRSLGDQGRFLRLLGSIGIQTLLTDLSSFGIFFLVIGTEKIDVIVVIIGGCSGTTGGVRNCVLGSLGELFPSSGLKAGDMVIPKKEKNIYMSKKNSSK